MDLSCDAAGREELARTIKMRFESLETKRSRPKEVGHEFVLDSHLKQRRVCM